MDESTVIVIDSESDEEMERAGLQRCKFRKMEIAEYPEFERDEQVIVIDSDCDKENVDGTILKEEYQGRFSKDTVIDDLESYKR